MSVPTYSVDAPVQVLACDDSGQRWVPATVSVLGLPGMPEAVGVKVAPSAGMEFPQSARYDVAVPVPSVSHLRPGAAPVRALRAVS